MSQEDDDWERKKEVTRLFSPEFRLLELFEKLTETVEKVDEGSRLRDEEQQRQISFILEQQAQFAVGMEQLREAQTRAEGKWDRVWERTNGSINALLAVAEMQTQEIAGLAQGQAQLAEAQANTGRQMAETDERLNALISVVEQFISERRNGG
jgi:cell division septum initiation protein DivIVA